MSEDMAGVPTKGRTDAATMIAELWAEREQGPSPAAPGAAIPEATKEPEPPRAGGKERALATMIVVLLVAAGLGIGAKAAGLLGAPSRASYAADGDAICAPGNVGLSAMSKPVGFPALATAASNLVTTTDVQLGQLRALDLPGGADRNRALAVLNAIAATGDAGRSLQSAATAGDSAMTAVASRSMTLYSQDAVSRAQAFGFTSCMAGMKAGIDALIAGANGAVKTSFTEKATVLCVDAAKASEKLPKIRTANDLNRYVAEAVALFERLATDMKAIPVPPGDEVTVVEITSSISNLAGKLREMGNAAAAGDAKRVNALEKEYQAMVDTMTKKMDGYGLSVCAE